MGRSLRLILHSKAAANPEVRAAVLDGRQRGHAVEVRVTWEAGDARRFAEEAARAGLDAVVAGGGDGTVNDVAAGLLREPGGHCPALGILPLGTANDFATSLGIPPAPGPALQLVTDGEAAAVDVGRVGQDRVLVNMATGGFGTQVTTETPEALKAVLGGAAYLVTGLTKFTSITSHAARVTGPGFAWEGSFLVLAVGNGRQAGGGRVLCPEAVIDDGLLDVRVLPGPEAGDLTGLLGALLASGFSGMEAGAVAARLPWVEVASTDGLNVNLDGEPLEGAHLRFEAAPGALRLYVPPGCPLLRSSRQI